MIFWERVFFRFDAIQARGEFAVVDLHDGFVDDLDRNLVAFDGAEDLREGLRVDERRADARVTDDLTVVDHIRNRGLDGEVAVEAKDFQALFVQG